MSDIKSGSILEKILKAGHFAFTGECSPPKGADITHLKEKTSYLKGMVDAVNITDNPTASVRMSSWAASLAIQQEGLQAVYQIVCRDRNRLAIQSDLLGASAHGIKNVLCLSGDHQTSGDHPEAKNVYDIDSIQLIQAAKNLRNDGIFINGEKAEGNISMFIGAASNPFAEPFDFRVYRLAKKISAGADFIQTQGVYNMNRFKEFMKKTVDMGLHEKCYILAGVVPLKNIGMAKYMATNVPGMDVPENFIKRLQDAGKENAPQEGIKIAVETIQELKEIEGISGVHLMAIEWEHKVPEIAKAAGVLPRPEV